jgi:hypothetical protein
MIEVERNEHGDLKLELVDDDLGDGVGWVTLEYVPDAARLIIEVDSEQVTVELVVRR